jgi:hypothetical protein
MLEKHLAYDPAIVRAAAVQRHGTVLGPIVSDAIEARRKIEDARAAELSTQLTRVQAEISVLTRAAGERRAKSKAELEASYSLYLEQCAEDARIGSAEQATIAPLTARSLELQREMNSIVQPRLNEKELHALVTYTSANAERLRAAAKELPPLAAPPMSALAKINASVGLK